MRGNAWSRGAEEFDALVSGDAGDGDAHAELLELVSALRAVPPVSARPEFVHALRTQLVAAAEREPARADDALAARLTPRQRRGSRERRLAAVVGGFAVVSATGSMAMASQDALPGDVLYPVKRALENAQTNLQSDNASKARSLITHAKARLAEAERLTARGAPADDVSAALQDFSDQAGKASDAVLDDYATTGDTKSIADLRSFAADSMAALSGLGNLIPADSRSILITATQTVRQIDVTAWDACPSCPGGAIAELPDLAALPLSAILSGTSVASVTDTKPLVTKEPKKTAPTQAPTDNVPPPPIVDPAVPPATDPIDTTKKATKEAGKTVGKTLDDVARGLTGTVTGEQPTNTTTTGPLGTLVDGVLGTLGGLLGTTK